MDPRSVDEACVSQLVLTLPPAVLQHTAGRAESHQRGTGLLLAPRFHLPSKELQSSPSVQDNPSNANKLR